MAMLLAFAPFLVFAIVDSLAGVMIGLVAGSAVSTAIAVRNARRPGRSPKVLEIGTAILFGLLAPYALIGGPTQSVFGVRLALDAGLLLIVLISIVIRRPFTLQYARERVAPEFWDRPAFIRSNYVITRVWALACAVMVLADIILVYEPAVPSWFGIGATILALLAALKFTSWYPQRQRTKAIAPP